jgi:hypothetical protein
MKIKKSIMEEIAKLYFSDKKSVEDIIHHFGTKEEKYGIIVQLTQGQVIHCINEMQYKYQPVILVNKNRSYKETLMLSLYEQGYSEQEIANRCDSTIQEVSSFLCDCAYETHRISKFPELTVFVS